MNIAFKCKFCAHEGVTTIADDYPRDMIRLEKWIPILCCQRCSDFMENKRKIQLTISRICHALSSCRLSLDSEKRSGMETKMRQALQPAARKFAELVCRYYHKQFTWDDEFPNMLADSPEKWPAITRIYMNGIAKV